MYPDIGSIRDKMKKVFYLKTCGTCKKILSRYPLDGWELREIKSNPITQEELAEMYQRTTSYEKLFSRKSTQIKAREIEVEKLKGNDFKDLLLSHYSFLKRPVFVCGKEIFIGNEKSNLEALDRFFNSDIENL